VLLVPAPAVTVTAPPTLLSALVAPAVIITAPPLFAVPLPTLSAI
jgi:hypothetical protein